jgi:3-hydroxy-9,10-secoandrosta-1,3,5(10)-triene-9,17-dione monooxygenase reductase component
MSVATDSRTFRRVLGHYPTGVCVITATQADGKPVGMAVGSFSSVSLDPPLVAFFPDRSSTSWPKIEAAGRFCVNILAEHQERLCQAFASKAEDKFAGISHRLSARGAPILDDVVAWIDCDLHAVHEAGDHFIVLGEVHALDVERPHKPLLFFQGGYGQFSPLATA